MKVLYKYYGKLCISDFQMIYPEENDDGSFYVMGAISNSNIVLTTAQTLKKAESIIIKIFETGIVD